MCSLRLWNSLSEIGLRPRTHLYNTLYMEKNQGYPHFLHSGLEAKHLWINGFHKFLNGSSTKRLIR